MNSDIKTKIEALVAAAESERDYIQEAPQPELSDREIARCALEGDAGDAAVYIMANQGKFLYMKRMGIWMKRVGQSWEKDFEAREATAAVAVVVDHYRRIYSEFKKLLDDYVEPNRETIADHSSIIGAEFKRNQLGKSVVQKYMKCLSDKIAKLQKVAGRKRVLKFVRNCLDDRMVISSSKVKWLPGGDRLAASGAYDLEPPYCDAAHTLIFLTNDSPHTRADDQAFLTRLYLTPFRFNFLPNPNHDNHSEKLADPDILENKQAEPSGILAWMVRGGLKYQKTDIKPPREVSSATLAYRESKGLIGRFLRECCIIHTDEDKAKGYKADEWKVNCAELFDAFSWWYARNVSQKIAISNIQFGKILVGQGFKKRKISTHYWLGIVVSETFKEERTEADKSQSAGRSQK